VPEHNQRKTRIARLRRAEGLSVSKLASEIGVDPEQLSRWESEEEDLPDHVQTILAARFGVDVAWLTARDSFPVEAKRLKPRRFARRERGLTGQRFTRLRLAEGLTREHLAAEIGVDAADIARWESSGSIPERHREALATRFGVTIKWLTGREEFGSAIIPARPKGRG
jgi:transcriptional regulator with XRE-family HTH domain